MVDTIVNNGSVGNESQVPESKVLNDLPTDGITCLQYLPKSQLKYVDDQQPNITNTVVDDTDEFVVSTSWDGHVRIHNTTTRNCVLNYNMNSGPLLSLTTLQQRPQQSSSLSPSSVSLVTGGVDGSIRLLDVETSVMTLIGRHVNHRDSSSSSTINANENAATSAVACSCLVSIGPNIVVSAGWHQQLHIWDIRTIGTTISTGSSSSSTQCTLQPIYTIQLPGKAFSMDIDSTRNDVIVVATSGRRNCFIELRYEPNSSDSSTDSISSNRNNNVTVLEAKLLLHRESSLKYQTRCVRFFNDGESIVLGSIEGRAAVEYLNDIPRQPSSTTTTTATTKSSTTNTKFAFKCHRINDMVYPVNAIACHPLYATFATGGCDGTVVLWDAVNKKKITSLLPSFPTSISALAFNDSGTEIAIASSYTYEDGEREHPLDEIYIRQLLKSECSPKIKP